MCVSGLLVLVPGRPSPCRNVSSFIFFYFLCTFVYMHSIVSDIFQVFLAYFLSFFNQMCIWNVDVVLLHCLLSSAQSDKHEVYTYPVDYKHKYIF